MQTKLIAAVLCAAIFHISACTPIGLAVGSGAVVARSVAQERSTFDALTDTKIGVSVNTRLVQNSGELFRDVAVDVNEGRVLLTGSVPTREDKVTATDIAWNTPGIVTVEDQLTLQEDSGTQAFLVDAWVSNKIRYALLTDLDVSSVNFNVTTVDKVVHLTGLARSEDELKKVIDHARLTEGVSRVVSHILTIDDPRRVDAVATTG